MMVWYQFVGVLIRLSLLISLDGWMENGRTRPSMAMLQIIE